VLDDDRLVAEGLLEPGAGARGALQLTATARALLAGSGAALRPEPARPFERHRDLLAGLVRHLRAGTPGAVVLRGPAGSGRRALAMAAAAAVGLPTATDGRSGPELRLLAKLGIALPLVAGDRLEELGWSATDPPLLAYAPAGFRAPGALAVDVPAPDHPQRTSAWSAALERAGLDSHAHAAVIAARFGFTEGDIDEVMARALASANWSGRPLDGDGVWEAARRQPEHALERVAALVTPAFTLGDLVLADDVHRQLRELVAHVALQHVVLDGWGFRRRLPRGQGVAALFAGPPGTGKTMAAEALADALAQDLYRIDLSAVVSKYIGETEKNLAAAFDEAERAGAVLLFDEADSLFGKRTEVKDAHDRYANLEVNYLLQRVETFTGLVLLASNRAAAIDEAFLRRLRFVVRFQLPDAQLRRRLWERSFPPEATRHGLDWDVLADGELAGGNIQSAALAAAYLAASDGGTIAPVHVEHALRREYEKLGRAWPGLALEPVA
jgi:hypothetical protein